MSRKRRPLSEEERRLWDLVRKTAEPLQVQIQRPAVEATKPAGAAPVPSPPPAKAKPVRQATAANRPSPPPAPPPAAPLDRRTRSRLSRGILEVDARLDLHGLTQTAAHQRLQRFLETAQAEGGRLVLVITGKGAPGELGEPGAPERGVLRRAVPEWLRSAPFRHLVVDFDEAARRHGGGGAIYVRLRRRRSGETG